MKRNLDLDLDLIFPIRDRASAIFMQAKADCLHKAAVINNDERNWVYSKAKRWLRPVSKAA